MPRPRKLFPVYGSSLANNILAALGRGHLVDRFVAAYVKEYERRGILGEASRDRELAETIGREIVLAMILEVRAALPRFFGKKNLAKLTQDEKKAADIFFQEVIGALDRAWQWNGDDRRQFRRDLALYSDFESRSSSLKSGQKGAMPREDERPFVGRVALLLDPSMIDQARRASRKFHGEVARLAQKLLRQTLRPGRI